VSAVKPQRLFIGDRQHTGQAEADGQTLVLGGAAEGVAQPHHIFDFVFSWTCVSSPMTAS